MMGVLLVAYVLMSAMVGATVGKGRFYLFRCQSGREFCHARYGAWVEKLFAGLSTAGLSLLVFIPLAKIIAKLADDYTEGPLFFSAFLIAVIAACYYQLMLEIARRCENDYRYRTVQNFVVPCRLKNGKKIVDAEDLLTAVERAQRMMSQYVAIDSGAELDIIDPSIPAELKRVKRSVLQRSRIEASRRHPGWGIVRPVGQRMVIGNLALDDEKLPTIEPEPKVETVLPIVNLKPTPEDQLNLQLAALSNEDRELVEQLFTKEPVIRRLILTPNCQVRLSIIPATETTPRHVQICGIVLHGRVNP